MCLAWVSETEVDLLCACACACVCVCVFAFNGCYGVFFFCSPFEGLKGLRHAQKNRGVGFPLTRVAGSCEDMPNASPAQKATRHHEVFNINHAAKTPNPQPQTLDRHRLQLHHHFSRSSSSVWVFGVYPSIKRSMFYHI